MKRGFALFTALVLVSIILVFSVILFQLLTTQGAKQQFDWQVEKARYIAEAGLTQAEARLDEWGVTGKPDEASLGKGVEWQQAFSGGRFKVRLEYVPLARRQDTRAWKVVSTGTFHGRTVTEFARAEGYDPLRKIVKFGKRSSTAERESVLARHGHVVRDLPMIDAAVVIFDSPEARSAASLESGVVRVDNDVLVRILISQKRAGAQGGGPQPAQTTPWGISRIQAPSAWGTSTARGVKIGIIDTGISTSHPDLRVAGGANIINPFKSYNDDNGHGSHVSGIVAALSNSIGVIGGGFDASLYAVKVLRADGSGFLSDVIGGIQWCVSHQIRVANMSLGTSTDVQSLHDAVTAATQAGLIIVAAAGNASGGAVTFPGAYPEVIGVSASTQSDTLASFSSVGPQVDVIAPGASILSTYKGTGYATLSGTSMAAPHATAACGLRLTVAPSTTPDQMRQALQATADPLPGLTTDQQGSGLVNALRLVQLP